MFIASNIKALPGEIFDLGQKIVNLKKFSQTRSPRLALIVQQLPVANRGIVPAMRGRLVHISD